MSTDTISTTNALYPRKKDFAFNFRRLSIRRYLKPLIFTTIIVLSVANWYWAPTWMANHGRPEKFWIGLDYHIYYVAAKTGDLTWGHDIKWDVNNKTDTTFLYPKWTVVLWKPLAQLPFDVSFLVWYSLVTLSYIFLSNKLLKVPYGWIFILAGLKPFFTTAIYGNVTPILAAISVTTLGCLLAGGVKLICFAMLPVHAVTFLRSHASKRNHS